MRSRFTTISLTVLAGAALFSAACGDDKPDHAAFEKRVQSICSASGERHGKVAPDFDFASFDPATSDLTTIVPVIEGHLAIGEETVTELKRLEGPSADEAERDKVVAIADKVHALGEQEVGAARAGDRAAFQRLTAEEEPIQEKLADYPSYEGC